jgi:N-acyl-D-aspartate/D-glutamate deacylase
VGKTLPLETIIKTQTMDAARIFGLNDRGVLAVGMRADLNVMDLQRLAVLEPYWANDLPTAAGRWLQHTEGYDYTVLRGVVTFQGDQHTGALPGRLVRNPLATNVPPARADEAVEQRDLTQYAVEMSRNGGASAVARVHRDDSKAKL